MSKLGTTCNVGLTLGRLASTPSREDSEEVYKHILELRNKLDKAKAALHTIDADCRESLSKGSDFDTEYTREYIAVTLETLI